MNKQKKGKPMEIREIPITEIKPAPYNPRKDLKPGDPEYEKLRQSISHFGEVEPVVWNQRTGNLVGGHQRLKILKERGDKTVQAVIVNLDESEEKALNIA
jgi:ParB-like chromosome segregation protein Spo0J